LIYLMEATCLMVLWHLKGECQAHPYFLSPCLIGLMNLRIYISLFLWRVFCYPLSTHIYLFLFWLSFFILLQSGYVDYEMLEKTAVLFRPKLIIAGASAYPREFDYPCMRKVCSSLLHATENFIAMCFMMPISIRFPSLTWHKLLDSGCCWCIPYDGHGAHQWTCSCYSCCWSLWILWCGCYYHTQGMKKIFFKNISYFILYKQLHRMDCQLQKFVVGCRLNFW